MWLAASFDKAGYKLEMIIDIDYNISLEILTEQLKLFKSYRVLMDHFKIHFSSRLSDDPL